MKAFIGLGALCLIPTIALAGDPSAMNPSAAMRSLPSWRGVYFGGHLGYGSESFNVFNEQTHQTSIADVSNDGALGGVHLGYNHQFGNWVVGVEGDTSFSWWKEKTKDSSGTLYNFQTIGMGSFRGRVGFAFSNLFIFGTAGIGVVDRDFKGRSLGSTDFSEIGAVAGGGIEYKLTRDIVVGLEGLNFFVKNDKRIGLDTDDSSNAYYGGGAGDLGLVRARLSFLW